MTGGEIFVECLKKQGVKVIFGMPGVQNVHIYDALYKRGKGIRHILVRNEQSASFMADGYARATGEVGVCLTVPGPGASSASTGMAEAYSDCVPVLLITGQADSRVAGRDESKVFHGLDLLGFFKPITRWSASPSRVDEIPGIVQVAFEVLRKGRPRPVLIEVSNDVASAEAEVEIPGKVEVPRPKGVEEDVHKVVEVLTRSNLPIILAGGGVVSSDASEELALLAKILYAPVVTTYRAKGTISEDHPFALGDARGQAASEALSAADAMLALGCRFTQLDTDGWSMEIPQHLIQVDTDVREIGREYPCEVGIVGDVKTVLMQLTEELKSNPRRRSNGWGSKLKDLKHIGLADQEPSLLTDMREVLARDAIVAVDVNTTGYRMRTGFKVYEPRTYLHPSIYGSLGYGFPAALGAKVAFPERQVISISGDGGFLMTCQELATAVQHRINVVAIVVNDNCLSSIKRAQERTFSGRYIAVDLHNPDFVQFASSFGARGLRVERADQFKPTLAEALKSDVPTVIEIAVSRSRQEFTRLMPWLVSGEW